MALEMNTLGGFLQLGPHFYPPRRKGAQVISRGPHGLRLAADPVHTREGNVRGSGFRFWSEQEVFAPNEQWNPRQAVVGVMGLGAMGNQYGTYFQKVAHLHQQYGIPFDGSIGALPNTDTPKYMEIARTAFPDKAAVREGLAELRQLVEAVPQGDLHSARRVNAMLGLVREAGAQHGNGGRSARIAELGRLQNLLIIKSGQKREDGKPMFAPGTVNPKTGEIILDPRTGVADHFWSSLKERGEEVFGGKGHGLCSREQLKVPIVGSMLCRGVGDPRAPFKYPIVTIALVAGGAILLYGLAKGFGGGLATRRSAPAPVLKTGE